jgi:peroxiredoxin
MKTLRIIISLFIGAVFCLSISAQDKFYYSISGNLLKKQNVKKVCVNYEIVGSKQEDCAAVKLGKFNLRKLIAQPSTAVISTDNADIKPVKIFLGNTDFVFDINDKISFVEKPKIQIEFEKLTVVDEIRPNYFGLFSELGEKNDEKGLSQINELFESLKKADLTIANLYFKNNPKSLLSVYAFERFIVFQDDYALPDGDFAQLPDLIKNSVIGKYVSKKIEGAKAAAVNKTAPNFSQIASNGKEIGLENFKGKYVLLDFWASWCYPCRGEHPGFIKLYNQYKSKNFEIVSVSIDEDRKSWADAAKADGIIWTSILDIKGSPEEIAVKYGVQAIPVNFLIDPNGVIIAKNVDSKDLEKTLADLLK